MSDDYTLINGDCLEVMAGMAAGSVDAAVMDPPYGLSKEPNIPEVLTHWLNGDDHKVNGGGFMGKTWDSFVPSPKYWRECYRVMKAGANLLVFCGTRTVDLMSISIRMAGFQKWDEISYHHHGGLPPQIDWCYGSGFPKSTDISKQIDKVKGAKREVDIHAKRTTHKRHALQDGIAAVRCGLCGNSRNGRSCKCELPSPATPEAQQWNGWGTQLKPAHEIILCFRKPNDGTFANNALRHGVAGINIDGTRIASTNVIDGTPISRFPANIIFDEEQGKALDAQSGNVKAGGSRDATMAGKIFNHGGIHVSFGDSGGASRFFYRAKAYGNERNEGIVIDNDHETVKPLSLMRYLVRLVKTPTGGVILDPFMGSGTTGVAALIEGCKFIGIEQDPDYYEIASRRMQYIANAKQGIPPELPNGKPLDDLPLFNNVVTLSEAKSL